MTDESAPATSKNTIFTGSGRGIVSAITALTVFVAFLLWLAQVLPGSPGGFVPFPLLGFTAVVAGIWGIRRDRHKVFAIIGLVIGVPMLIPICIVAFTAVNCGLGGC